jgi:hypothetical protein
MLNGNQIREVTPQGIRYLDENNIEQFIDFAQCYADYEAAHLKPEHWIVVKEWNHWTDNDWDQYVERVKEWKEVGARNIAAKKPYIVFYSQPHIEFEFETLEEWQKTVVLMQQVGYVTYDLS